ncbi:hypothetical protein ATDW_36140 (plasmid) [Asticcacaulis sp. DW145]|uniref:hypothetical protein n=1 Tax=Asticcacaulis sp. DW145 TaxID=3095608 RepID=UPI0030855D78|nr:hypothetical protein ATDW_36140 [Asticcacaulis sp. DW145]
MEKHKEYWFRWTWFGSATPIHLMGVLTLFGGIAVAFAIFYSGVWLLNNGYGSFGKPLFGVFAVWVLWLIIFISSKTERR